MDEGNLNGSTQTDDDACGKLWEVYLAEAQRYDEGLVRSWKEDMDVTLVFSGLYSAVLTAFVIESYKNLQEDYTETSANLLRTLSEQLLSAPGERSTIQAQQDPFIPSSSAVACNVLWFLSLTMALMCAFLATFFQQWTRHFLHRTTILRASTSRARLFSFLYFGLKRFGMHAIVDVIPSLLHVSLFCFFGGLFAFLFDVNKAISWLIACALTFITLVYLLFTIFPVITLDSPFQTPLSPIVWKSWEYVQRALQVVRNGLYKATATHTKPQDAILPITTNPRRHLNDAMFAASHHHDRHSRESASLVWTLRSLNHDTELLPFIEALPDVIYGPEGLRVKNIPLLKTLLETSDPRLDIIARTVALVVNGQNPWFSPKHQQRCLTSGPRVLWGLTCILTKYQESFSLHKTTRLLWFTRETIESIAQCSSIDAKIKTSIITLCCLNAARCAESLLRPIAEQETDADEQIPVQFLGCFFGGLLLESNLLEGLPSMDCSHAHLLIQHFERYRSRLHLEYLMEAKKGRVYNFDQTNELFGLCTPSNPIGLGTAFYTELCQAVKQNHLFQPGTQHHNLNNLDHFFTLSLQDCQKEDAPEFVTYINARVRAEGWAVTRRFWSKQSKGSIVDFPNFGLQCFYRILYPGDTDALSDDRANTIREVLFCFHSWNSIGVVHPFWPAVLSSLQAVQGKDLSPTQHSLCDMVQLMLLKKAALGDAIPLQRPSSLDSSSLSAEWVLSSRSGHLTPQAISHLTLETIGKIMSGCFSSRFRPTLRELENITSCLETLTFLGDLSLISSIKPKSVPGIMRNFADVTHKLAVSVTEITQRDLLSKPLQILSILWDMWIEWDIISTVSSWHSEDNDTLITCFLLLQAINASATKRAKYLNSDDTKLRQSILARIGDMQKKMISLPGACLFIHLPAPRPSEEVDLKMPDVIHSRLPLHRKGTKRRA